MPFSTRNALYLRISSWTVLPLYLYLDERHVTWMSDLTLQMVLEDLRPKLVTKLQAEDPAKKSQVEVHRGDTYQFAFFFRKTDSRHVVLLKKREYMLRPTRAGPTVPKSPPARPLKRSRESSSSTHQRSEARQVGTSGGSGTSKRPRAGSVRSGSVSLTERGVDGLISDDDDEEEHTTGRVASDQARSRPSARSGGEVVAGRQRSTRSTPRPIDYSEDPDDQSRTQDEPLFLDDNGEFGREDTPLQAIRPEDEVDEIRVKAEPLDDEVSVFGAGEDELTALGEEDTEGDEDEEYVMRDPDMDGTEDVDDKKELKPEMRLSYTGFSIASRQLVLIIEPFPAIATEPTRSSSSRPRASYSRATSREMHLHRFGSASTSAFGSATPGIDRDQSLTPLLSVPNSRRGGTATGNSATATPAPGDTAPGLVGAAAIAAGINANSSRDASVANRRSETPLMMNPRYTASFRNTPRETPDFGHGGDGYSAMDPPPSRNRDRTPLFGRDTPFEDAEDDEEEEDDQWRRNARSESWAPFRGGSAAPDMDFVDDEEDDELMNEARGVLAMSQSLQGHMNLRAGKSTRASGEGDEGDFADGDGEDPGDGVGGAE